MDKNFKHKHEKTKALPGILIGRSLGAVAEIAAINR